MSKAHKGKKRPQLLPNGAGKSSVPERLLHQARDALAAGQVDFACQLLAAARGAVATADGRDLLTDALSLQALERWDKPLRAVASIERALEVPSADADFVRLRGSLLRRGGRARASLPFLVDAQKLVPDDPLLALETVLTAICAREAAQRFDIISNGANPAETSLAEGILAATESDLGKAEMWLAGLDRPVASLLRGMVRLAKGEATAALPALRQNAADETLPAIARAYASFYYGLAQMRCRALRPAAEALRQAISLGVPIELIQDHLVWTYNQLVIDAVLDKDLASATDWLISLSELGGPKAQARDNVSYALRLYGQEKAKAGDYSEAARHWRKALEMQPRDFVLRQNLAVALERADLGDEAIPHWHELIQQLTKVVKSSKVKGEGRPPKGDDELSHHVLALAHRHLADLYVDEDETPRAIAQLERALDVLPDDTDARYELARLLVEEGDYGKSAGHLERVVAERPNWAEGLLRLGGVRYRLGAFDSAVATLERAHELAPHDPTISSWLGKAIAAQVIHHPISFSALDDARRAISLLRKGEIEGLMALATVEFVRGKRKEASKILAKCTREATAKVEALIEVGHAYLKAGEQKQAASIWARAMKKAERNPSEIVPLAKAWATIEDVGQCAQCFRWLIGWSRWISLEAVDEIAALPNGKPLLRKVLDALSAESTDTPSETFAVDCLLRIKDLAAARERINKMALDAVAKDDQIRIRFAIDRDYDYKPRLLERKTAFAVMKWIEDHPGQFGMNYED